MSDPWIVSQTDFAQLLPWEGLFTLGSPGLHVRGCLEEAVGVDPQNREYMRSPGNVTAENFPEGRQKWGTYVPGIYGRHPRLNAQLVNLPWFAGVGFVAGGESLDTSRSRTFDHRRELDLRRAVLTRSLGWTAADGAVLRMSFERFVAADAGRLLAWRVRLESDRAIELEMRTGIDSDVRTNGYDHFTDRTFAPRDGRLSAAVLTDRGDRVEIRRATSSSIPGERVVIECAGRAIVRRDFFRLGPRQPLVCDGFGAVSTSRDRVDLGEAEELMAAAVKRGYEAVRTSHEAEWEARWRGCDVEIDGPEVDQRALRVSLFHMLRSHPRNERLAIDPKGYAGDAYFGRFFWDTEMCLLPFFLYTDPARARELLAFRNHSLQGARRNAARYGYPGARFAWESDDLGDENCAAWEYADHEIHVSADIIYALAHHDAAVPATPLLAEFAPLVVETCRFWAARCDRRPGDEHPSLLGVMGPDEYAHFSDNNAYTNRVVKLAFSCASGEVGVIGGASMEERTLFRQLAESLAIPRSASDPRLVLQCDGYDRRVEASFEQRWRDRSKPYASQVSQERLYRSQNLKQADVLLMQWLFAHEFSEDELRAAWDYYVPRTTHDSSLSAGTHALVAARLGKIEEAYSFWLLGSRLDIAGGAAQGIHIASAGSAWMMAAFGFAGMATAFESTTLTLRPRMPAQWRAIRFPLIWRGMPVRVEVRHDSVAIENLGQDELVCRVVERTIAVPAGRRVLEVRRPARISAVIFDLDGVIVSTDGCHARAWRRLAEDERISVTSAQLERCRGVGRMESLGIVLEQSRQDYDERARQELADRKNRYYRESLEQLTRAEILPGVERLLADLRQRGLRTAIASSSRNAPLILERIGLADRFDAIADGNDIARSKPDPEVFELAARRLRVPHHECLVVEDAEAGVMAARAAGMRVVGVGSAHRHPGVDLGIPSLDGVDIETLLSVRCRGVSADSGPDSS